MRETAGKRDRVGGRALARWMAGLLRPPAADLDAALAEIRRHPSRRTINPLFSFFYSGDRWLRWRSIAAMGAVVADLAEAEPESARVAMRRLMWNLNDESGGIGWGSPEAMGEIMARSAPMAGEYNRILVSYVREDGNFLEHPMLQRGALWGLGRLARARPERVAGAAAHLAPFLASDDPAHRGLALWAAGGMDASAIKSLIQPLADDKAIVEIYLPDRFATLVVGELAKAALG